jgi:hypothetical protein
MTEVVVLPDEGFEVPEAVGLSRFTSPILPGQQHFHASDQPSTKPEARVRSP